MSAEAREILRRHFNLPPERDPYEYWHEGLLQRFRIDLRRPMTPYIGPPLATYPDGSWDSEYGERRKGYGYGVPVSHPLQNAQDLGQIFDYPLPDPDGYDYSGLADYCRRNERYAITGGSKFPFLTIACDLMGMERLMINLIEAPDLIQALLHRLVDLHLRLTQRWLEAAPGMIDILIITDDYGSNHDLLISPRHWQKLIRPELERIIDFAHDWGVKVMLHSDGALRRILPDLVELGLDILNPIEPEAKGMDPAGIKRDYGSQIALHGGVSARNLALKTADQVRAEVKGLIETVAPGGGYILCPTNHILEDMPVENVIAMYDVAYQCGAY